VAQQGDEHLRARVDPAALHQEGGRPLAQQLCRREFVQNVLAEAQIEAGIAASNGVADLVALMRIEEQDLIALRDRVVTPDMADEDTAIGKDQMGGVRTFLAAAMPSLAGADDVAHQHDLAVEKLAHRELRHACFPRCAQDEPAGPG